MNSFQLNHSQLKVGTILWMFAMQMERLISDGYSFDTRLGPVCLILQTLCVPSWIHWAMHCSKLYGHWNLNLYQWRLKGQSDWQMRHRWTVNIIPFWICWDLDSYARPLWPSAGPSPRYIEWLGPKNPAGSENKSQKQSISKAKSQGPRVMEQEPSIPRT